MVAFSLCRASARHVIGPVVAASDEEAIAVTHPHYVDHGRHSCGLTNSPAEAALSHAPHAIWIADLRYRHQHVRCGARGCAVTVLRLVTGCR